MQPLDFNSLFFLHTQSISLMFVCFFLVVAIFSPITVDLFIIERSYQQKYNQNSN